MTDKRLVLSTCGSHEVATKIARALVVGQIAACVNVLGPMESVYRWKGTVETSHEFLLVIKTRRKEFAGLQRVIREMHSYEVPEIVALPIVAGSERFLAWLNEQTSAGPAS